MKSEGFSNAQPTKNQLEHLMTKRDRVTRGNKSVPSLANWGGLAYSILTSSERLK